MNTRPPNPPPKYPHVYVRADVPDRMGQPFICRCGRAGLAEGERGSGCAAAMRERIAALEEERDAALARVAELERTTPGPHITPALMRRVEALGFVPGSGEPVGWLVAHAEELEATLANERAGCVS